MTAALDARVVVELGGFRLDVEVAIAAGEVVAVMGPSGAGKSTLLGALAGLVRPTVGRIRIGDPTLDAGGRRGAHVAPMHRGIVLLGQEPRLFPHLTAAENVAFALRARGAHRSRVRAEAATWLDRVGLPDAGARRPAALSGGQQQRIALARALAAAPQAVLLDEPLTSLDAETAADIRTLVAEQLAATGTTAIVVTHDAVDALALATRLVLLEGGVVTQEGPVRAVLASPATRFAATVAGVSRLEGVAHGGAWASGSAVLRAEDPASIAVAARDGRPLAAIVPASAVHLRRLDAGGAIARVVADAAGVDAWVAPVVRLEATLGGVRVVTALPSGAGTVATELPVSAVADLALAPGVVVEVRVERQHVRLLAR